MAAEGNKKQKPWEVKEKVKEGKGLYSIKKDLLVACAAAGGREVIFGTQVAIAVDWSWCHPNA